METWTDAQRAKLSRHFAGLAFDVQPVFGSPGEAIKATIRKLPLAGEVPGERGRAGALACGVRAMNLAGLPSLTGLKGSLIVGAVCLAVGMGIGWKGATDCRGRPGPPADLAPGWS